MGSLNNSTGFGVQSIYDGATLSTLCVFWRRNEGLCWEYRPRELIGWHLSFFHFFFLLFFSLDIAFHKLYFFSSTTGKCWKCSACGIAFTVRSRLNPEVQCLW